MRRIAIGAATRKVRHNQCEFRAWLQDAIKFIQAMNPLHRGEVFQEVRTVGFIDALELETVETNEALLLLSTTAKINFYHTMPVPRSRCPTKTRVSIAQRYPCFLKSPHAYKSCVPNPSLPATVLNHSLRNFSSLNMESLHR